MSRTRAFAGGLAGVLLMPGCGSLVELARIIQPPRFSQADGRRAELRVLLPSAEHRAGGAAIRIWTEIENPNAFGLTVNHVASTLFLEESRAAVADFPLELPLGARSRDVVPLDLTVDFADVAGLRVALDRAIRDRKVGYRLDGTISIDAGPFGARSFGPLTYLTGDLDVIGLLSAVSDQRSAVSDQRSAVSDQLSAAN
jgi:hypothetical protein